jgi:uracil-DNA glycosylase
MSETNLSTNIESKMSETNLTTINESKMSETNLTTINESKVSKTNLSTNIESKISESNLTTINESKISEINLLTNSDNNMSESNLLTSSDNNISELNKIKIRIKFKVDQTWNIYDIATKNVPISWESAFKNADEELKHISNLLFNYETKNGISFPYKSNIFKAFELTRLENVRCVFVAPEPYNTTDMDGSPLATGLALSVKKSSTIPKSLYNLYTVMSKQIPDFVIPTHGDLTDWAKNGILLLNISLTVKNGESKSHSELWTGFTMKIIEEIMVKRKNIPFFFLGKECNKIANFISGSCPIYVSNSGYSMAEDLGSAFNEMNKFLNKHNLEPINFKIGN